MKRITSIMLALLMIFGLMCFTACNDTADSTTSPSQEVTATASPPPATEDEGETEAEKTARLEASKPNEYIQEKLDAGMEVTVAFLAVEFGSTTMLDLDAGFKAGFEAAGFSYTSSSFDIDTTVQLSSIENYITMGVAEIITIVFDPSMEDIIGKAIEAGTYVACWGSAVDFRISLATGRDFAALGVVVANMMIAWADENANGTPVKTAILANTSNESYVAQTDAMMAALDASANVEVVYTSTALEMSIDSGFNFAEEAFTIDSDVRMLLGYTFAQALGVNNYITTLPNIDLSQYGVFSADMDSSANDLLSQSQDGDGCFRGYASCGLEEQHAFLMELSLQLLFGELEAGSTVLEPLWVKTNYSYEYDER